MSYQQSIAAVKNINAYVAPKQIPFNAPHAKGVSVDGEVYTYWELLEIYGEHLGDMSNSDIKRDLKY